MKKLQVILKMKNPSIFQNLIIGLIIAIILITYRLVIKYYLLNDANKDMKTPEGHKKNLLIIGGGYSANDIIKTLNSSLKGKYEIIGIIDDNNKRRLRDAFNDGAMILIDLHELDQREFEERGREFIMFWNGIAFARKGEIKFIEPAQYLVTPKADMFEIWPEGGETE